MPVYKQTYRHYSGVYYPRAAGWLVIAMRELKRRWSSKGFRFLLVVCLIVFFVNLFRIYLVSNIELVKFFGFNIEQFERILNIDEKFYFDFLRLQNYILFLFLVTIVVGSDSIASDRRTKAIVLYLSRPLGRLDYLFGKGSVILFYLYCITLFPAWLLMFFYAFFHDNWQYLVDNIPLALRIFAFSNVMVIPMVFIILAISSMVKSGGKAGVIFSAVYFLPPILGAIFGEMFGDPLFGHTTHEWWSLISLQTIWDQLGGAIFQQTPVFGNGMQVSFEQSSDFFEKMHWSYHAVMLALILLLCTYILHRQIRAVEVVK